MYTCLNLCLNPCLNLVRACGYSLRDELMGMGFRIDDKANTWSGPGGRGGSLLGDFGKLNPQSFSC